MNWKKILKSPPALTEEEEKEISDMMRFQNMEREEAERKIRRRVGKLGQRNKPTYEDYMRKEDIESKILAEIEKEGGALGMKNLKQFGSESEIKEALENLKRKNKIYEHRDGDIISKKDKKDMRVGQVYTSDRAGKKIMMLTHEGKKIHAGAKGYGNYKGKGKNRGGGTHTNKKRRANFKARHNCDQCKGRITTPKCLACKKLW
jgi:hypothetical protein